MSRALIIIFFITLLSCRGKSKEEIPPDIIPPVKMTEVLVDVHILEAATGLNVIQQNDTTHKDTNMFYNVFENNQVSKKQYDESMDYYMKHPDLLNQIYDSVIATLDEVKDTLKKK